MTDRPIIFSGPMVRALLEGRKSMTRRLLSLANQLSDDHNGVRVFQDQGGDWNLTREAMHTPGLREPFILKVPYAVGDRLYVRESYAPRYFDGGKDAYQADWTGKSADCVAEPKWTPAIHQFKKDSRITLTVEAVKVERLQDITKEDAIAEGLREIDPRQGWYTAGVIQGGHEYVSSAVMVFKHLWQSLNAKRAPWDNNPWVVAITFRVEKINIDSLKSEAA